MWRFQRWQGQGVLYNSVCVPLLMVAGTRTGEPRKGKSMQCGRLKVTLCPKAAVKVHSRSRAAAPTRQGGFPVNSTELRLDTPASISSHELDSIIWCNARVDGEKSLVNIEPGAAAARHFCVDVLANFELPAPWRRRGLQVIGSRWSRIFTLCAQFGTPASGLRIDGCRTCAGNGANDYKRFGSKWRRQASHLHQLGHKIWGSLY